ncbi:MAG: DUF4870 domain-containing protein [Nocardioides sp.]
MSTGPEPPQPPPSDENRPDQQPGPPPAAAQPPGVGQPPAPGDGPPPPVSGYAPRPPMRPDEEKLWGIGAHLGPLVLGFIAPLIVWLVFKDRSAFLDRTGTEAQNMQQTYHIYFFVAGLSLLLLVGIVLLPLVGLAWLVLMIVATVKVANFEDYRYPAIIRFLR